MPGARKRPRGERAELQDWETEREPTPREIEQDARTGSFMLRVALLRYGAAQGLPNLSPAACLAILQELARSKEGRRAARLLKRATAGKGKAASGRARPASGIAHRRRARRNSLTRER